MAHTDVTQARIEAIARATPGIHAAQLAMVLGLAWNTTMHHVRAMEKEQRLAVHKIDGKLRIFDRQRGAFRNKVAAAVLQDPQNRKVAVYVLQNPGRSQRELARALDLSTTAVHRRLSRLEDAGLLQRLAAGRCTLVHATDDLPDAFVETGLRPPAARKAEVGISDVAAEDSSALPPSSSRPAPAVAGLHRTAGLRLGTGALIEAESV